MKRTSGLLWALVLAVGTASCGGGGTGPGGGGGGGGGGDTCPANTFCATISNTFSPKTLTVTVGSTVTWLNNSGSLHNIVWNDATGRNAALAGDDSGDIGSFSSGSHTRLFNAAGTYGFQCTLHPGMTGTLTVQ